MIGSTVPKPIPLMHVAHRRREILVPCVILHLLHATLDCQHTPGVTQRVRPDRLLQRGPMRETTDNAVDAIGCQTVAKGTPGERAEEGTTREVPPIALS